MEVDAQSFAFNICFYNIKRQFNFIFCTFGVILGTCFKTIAVFVSAAANLCFHELWPLTAGYRDASSAKVCTIIEIALCGENMLTVNAVKCCC
jgi:hypothetical protein